MKDHNGDLAVKHCDPTVSSSIDTARQNIDVRDVLENTSTMKQDENGKSEGGEQTFAAGWALSIAISSYTAPALLIGSYAGFSATRVGLVWNRAYTVICGCILSLWVLAFAYAF